MQPCIDKSQERKDILDAICHIFCETDGFCLVWIGFAENDQKRSIRPMAWAGSDEEYVATMNATWNDDETGQCPAGTAIRTGKTDVIQNWSDTARNGPWKNSGSKNGIRSSLAIPLINDGKAIGALMLYANEVNGFTHEKICLLEEITRDLTYKLVNMRSQEEGQKTAETLRNSREVYSRLIDSIPDPIVLMDLDGNIELVNSYVLKISGYAKEEVIGRSIFVFIASEDMERAKKNTKAMAMESLGPIIYGLIMKGGRRVQFEANGNVLRNADGSPIGLVLVGRDITSRMMNEEELKASKLRLAMAMDAAKLVYWEYDEHSDIYTFNDRFYALYGTDAEKENGYLMSRDKYLNDFIHPDDVGYVKNMEKKLI